MKIWVGITDKDWFDYLTNQRPDEVNFWTPSGATAFRALQPGEPFLFKLRSPLNFIVGGGFFVRHSFFPLSLAWEVFGEKNGAPDIDSVRSRIINLGGQLNEMDPMIGCIILTQPFFFQRSEWIPQPSNWSSSIQRGKMYSTDEQIGAELWIKVQNRLANLKEANAVFEGTPRYGADYLVHTRFGQAGFRAMITDIYNRRCAITRERTLPVLDAAHIKPYAKSGPHKIKNGLLLRSDLHKLLDSGFMTITSDFHVEVSKRIREEYKNGREYYALHGKELNLPSNRLYLPSSEYIEWHNQEVYKS